MLYVRVELPVEQIAVPSPDAEGLTPDQYDVIEEKVTYRLAQRPGSYVVLVRATCDQARRHANAVFSTGAGRHDRRRPRRR